MRASTVICIAVCAVFTVYAGQPYTDCIQNLVNSGVSDINRNVSGSEECTAKFNTTMTTKLASVTNMTDHEQRYRDLLGEFKSALDALLSCLKENGASDEQLAYANTTLYAKEQKARADCHDLTK